MRKRHEALVLVRFRRIESKIRIREHVDFCHVVSCGGQIACHRRRGSPRIAVIDREYVIGEDLKFIAFRPADICPPIRKNEPHQGHGPRPGVEICLQCRVACRTRIGRARYEQPLPRARGRAVSNSRQRRPVFSVNKCARDVVFQEHQCKPFGWLDIDVIGRKRDSFGIVLEVVARCCRSAVDDERRERRIGWCTLAGSHEPVCIRSGGVCRVGKIPGGVGRCKNKQDVVQIGRPECASPEVWCAPHGP